MINTLWTRKQLLMILKEWEIKADPPRKGKKLVVVWPKFQQPSVAEIKKTAQKSIEGRVLYSVEYRN